MVASYLHQAMKMGHNLSLNENGLFNLHKYIETRGFFLKYSTEILEVMYEVRAVSRLNTDACRMKGGESEMHDSLFFFFREKVKFS